MPFQALPGVRDPAQLLLKGYLLHHAAAAVGYLALLHCQRPGAPGARPPRVGPEGMGCRGKNYP